MKRRPLILGVIPARGGSKRIPRKNLALLAGRPLITYTIDVARQVSWLTRTIVSTDDREIAEVAQQAGADVPYLRPRHLARDDTPTSDVVRDTLAWIESAECRQYERVCVLEPTAPLRTVADVEAAFERWHADDTESLVGLVPVSYRHPGRLRVVRGHRAFLWAPELWREGQRWQEWEPVYAPGGGLFAAKRDVLVHRGSLHGETETAYVFPPERGLDIDSPLDLAFAEFLIGRTQAMTPR